MLKQKNLITNDVFNTDKFGFRYTDSFKKFTDYFSNINQELTVIKNSNIAFDLDTSEDLDLLTLEQRNKLFKDNDN